MNGSNLTDNSVELVVSEHAAVHIILTPINQSKKKTKKNLFLVRMCRNHMMKCHQAVILYCSLASFALRHTHVDTLLMQILIPGHPLLLA